MSRTIPIPSPIPSLSLSPISLSLILSLSLSPISLSPISLSLSLSPFSLSLSPFSLSLSPFSLSLSPFSLSLISCPSPSPSLCVARRPDPEAVPSALIVTVQPQMNVAHTCFAFCGPHLDRTHTRPIRMPK